MTVAETEIREEIELVEAWRAEQLEMAGYGAQTATEIAMRLDIDLHIAIDLLASGCSAELAAQILLSKQAPGAQGRIPCPVSFLASIPSPSSGTIDLGPFTIHMYGLMLLLAIAAAVRDGLPMGALGGDWDSFPRRRVGRRGRIVGARAYHVVTSWTRCPTTGGGCSPCWRAGSASGAGSASASSRAHRRSPLPPERGAVHGRRRARAAVAQAIGRGATGSTRSCSVGRPTCRGRSRSTRSTARRATSTKRPSTRPSSTSSIVRPLGVGDPALIDRLCLRPPGLFALYVSLYCFGRFFEGCCASTAHAILGLRLNAWVSIVVFVLLDGVLHLGGSSFATPSSDDRPRARQHDRADGPGDGRSQGSRPLGTLGWPHDDRA